MLQKARELKCQTTNTLRNVELMLKRIENNIDNVLGLCTRARAEECKRTDDIGTIFNLHFIYFWVGV